MTSAGRGAGRLPAALALVGSFALSLGACRDLVAGDATDFGRDLCGELAVCVGLEDCDARDRLDADAGRTTPESVQAYFDAVAGYDCLDSCRDARACRDRDPVCRRPGEACSDVGACCGASQRLGRCQGAAEGGGSCCGERGARCEEDAECCDAEACEGGRCGGVTCLELEAPCTNAFACCSRRCEGGTCAPSTCGDVGEACQGDGDCCAQQTPDGPVALVCEAGTCAPPPDVCVGCEAVNDPARNCCLAQGLRCFEAIDGSSFCAAPTCLPTGVACGDDADCCEGVCNQSNVPHCALPCDAGGGAGCCVTTAGACTVDSECCSGGCIAGRCAGIDPGCEPAVCHDPCASGEPLDASCTDDVAVTCLASVCAERPACCCSGWTIECALAYDAVCEQASCTP